MQARKINLTLYNDRDGQFFQNKKHSRLFPRFTCNSLTHNSYFIATINFIYIDFILVYNIFYTILWIVENFLLI